jgi:hypothetical protein
LKIGPNVRVVVKLLQGREGREHLLGHILRIGNFAQVFTGFFLVILVSVR